MKNIHNEEMRGSNKISNNKKINAVLYYVHFSF